MLRITNLNKTYAADTSDEHHAVRGIDIDIPEGEFFTLLGPSGCGKTTTLRCVAGLETVDSGEITIGGHTVSSQNRFVPPNKRDIGMVFQSYAIWPHMTVLDNVAFPLEAKGVRGNSVSRREARKLGQEALETVKLGELGGRRATDLSGGQQQRVALARALVARPRVLLLDEPLSNLDAALRTSMRLEIRRIHQDLGMTTLFVTHDQTEALSMSDRIAVMDRGTIAQAGPPQELYDHPASRYVGGFLGRLNLLNGEVTQRKIDELRVAIGQHVIQVTNGEDFSVGDAVEVGVRPERLGIALAGREGQEFGSDSANQIRGRIEQVVFNGDSIDYMVEIGIGRIIVAATSNVRISAGSNVVVHAKPADVSVFRQREHSEHPPSTQPSVSIVDAGMVAPGDPS